MTPIEYEYLQKTLKERSGLILSSDKQYLVESRLTPLARRSGLAGISDVVAKMKAGNASLIASVVEAMTTNETLFFRDRTPFALFRDVILPERLSANAAGRSLRICSRS